MTLKTMASPTNSMVQALAKRHPVLGLSLLHHRNTRGQPMSFEGMPYLVELYVDGPRIDGFDAMKCVQVGWSEYLIQLALSQAGWDGRIVGYVLPSYQLRDRFVQRRIQPLLERIPAYQDKLSAEDPGSVRHQRFGKGALLWLGSNAVNDFIEFSADVLVVDEYDRCDQTNLAFARDRLRASERPQMFRISNPTLPGQGIAALYDVSDGRKWHHQCPHCNERQAIDWFQHIVDKDDAGRWVLRDSARVREGVIRPICRRCGKPWDRVAKGGMWVAERPSKSRRGYQLSRMDVLTQNIRELWEEFQEAQGHADKMSAFWASVLGLPFQAEGQAVTAGLLQGAATAPPMDHGGDPALKKARVVAGIDVGSVLHVDVARIDYDETNETETRTGRFTGEVPTFAAARDLLIRYGVDIAVIDAYPETRKSQELRDWGRDTGVCDVWLCEFHKTARVGAQDFGMVLDWKRHVVRVDRTQLLDATLADIQRNPPHRTWPEDIWQIKDWRPQMEAPKRIENTKGTGYVWDEGRSADHYRLSDGYNRVAKELFAHQGGYHV